jgi:hypothetical protein
MTKLLALGVALALTSIACGSSDSNDSSNTGTNTNTLTATNTGTGTCVGASSNNLIGGCSGMMSTNCFEEYAPTAPTAAMVKAVSDACTGYGGTFAASGCALAAVGCICTETQSSYKMITYWPGATCYSCTGDCKSSRIP